MVIISYIITFGSRSEPYPAATIALLIVLGVIYTLLGIYGSAFYQRSELRWALIAYFCILIPLGATILYLSGLGAWLLLLPLAGSAVEWLTRRWMMVVCALIAAAMALGTALALGTHVDATGERLFPFGSGAFWTAFQQNMLAFGSAIVFVVLFTQTAIRERRTRAEAERLAAELRNANRQLREYAAQAEELATAHERNRMAREIHDGLGHYLTAINMQIQAGRAVLEHDRALAFEALDKAQTLAKEGLAEVRRSVASLRASPLDNCSLLEAITSQVDECRAAGVATSLVVRGKPRPLSPQIELALYRVAQEGLTNICKHAQASSAEVIVDYLDVSTAGGMIRLTVSDSGVGSDDPSGGFGLVGVRERMHILGGQVHIETAPGEGFTLRANVPVPDLPEGLALSPEPTTTPAAQT
jgi:signal transduction histidine kinase